MTAYQRVADALVGAGSQPPRTESGPWRCPAHDDGQASLSVTERGDRVLLHCHAGCDLDTILGTLKLAKSDLFDEPKQRERERSRIARTYDYTDEAGTLLYQVVRLEPKSFRQRRPDGAGGWSWTLQGVDRVPYRLPGLVAAVDQGRWIFVVEGEKDVEALERAGEVATCNAGGAGKWDTRWQRWFHGATVVVVADRDEPGYRHAQQVRDNLAAVASAVTVVQAAVGKDAADHLGAGRTVAEFEQITDELDALAGRQPEPATPTAPVDAPDPLTGIRAKLRTGSTFVLDRPAELAAVWGSGDDVLWAAGESLIIAAPPGVGKTTLAVQLVEGRLGLADKVLGWPVEADDRPVLYLAMDRPRQIQRAMLRRFGEQHRPRLDERLVVWEGPLPSDLGRRPELLADMADAAGAGTVILDSLKDAVVKLTDDEAGGNLNRAIQTAVVAGVEVLGLHH